MHPASTLEEAFRAHRRHLWDLAYRLTGSATEANDIVQETFVRALASPPPDAELPWLPWLVRVTTNLSLDALRKRKRRSYVGPWLPAPIDTGDAVVELASSAPTTAERYELLESITFAFLLALETLTPRERAVLVLRSVFEYPVGETARALGLSEANVKTVHHRARTRMKAYDQARCLPTRTLQDETRRVFVEFLSAMRRHDVAEMERLLAEAARALTDSNGKFIAARSPVAGRDRVVRFFDGLSRIPRTDHHVSIRTINGLPALWSEFSTARTGEAPRMLLRCDLDPDFRISALHFVLAPDKLAGLRSD
jgi:RNA polymerase sigma factor (sigma-70 family)